MQVNGEQVSKLKHPMSKERISKQELLCKTETKASGDPCSYCWPLHNCAALSPVS